MGFARWLVGVLAAVGTLGGQELTKLTPEAAGQVVGRDATVCGTVVGFDCTMATLVFQTSSKGPSFEVATGPLGRAPFEAPLESRYFGQQVCASGTVLQVPNGYRIRASMEDQLRIAGPPNAAAAAAAEGVLWCPRPGQLPRIVHETKPQYTAKAMRAGVQGVVGLIAIVDAAGSIRHAEVKRSLDPDLDQEALKAVRQWQFEPGTQDGTPVPVAVGIELTFTLRTKKQVS